MEFRVLSLDHFFGLDKLKLCQETKLSVQLHLSLPSVKNSCRNVLDGAGQEIGLWISI